jgi:hypothetical protein
MLPKQAGAGKGGLIVVFLPILILNDLLFPQELEAFINEMPILLAVFAKVSLVEAIPVLCIRPMIPFLKSSSLFNPSTIPSLGKVGNHPISNRFFRHLSPIFLNIESLDLSIELRQLQGVDSFPHRLLKSLPGGTQGSKEGDVDIDVRERCIEVVIEVL